MKKQLLLGLVLIQISSNAFPFCLRSPEGREECTPEPVTVLPAKKARDIIMNTVYKKHEKAIDWWVTEINKKIIHESDFPSASVTVDITAASDEVQRYLQMAYEREGYTAQIMGNHWRHHPYYDKNVEPHYYLGLSW